MSKSWSTSELDDGISALIADMRNELPNDLQELKDLFFRPQLRPLGGPMGDGMYLSVSMFMFFFINETRIAESNKIVFGIRYAKLYPYPFLTFF